jgi:hypothetical protein
MKILDLLEGATESENRKWAEFLLRFNSTDFNTTDEKILWYPSSGDDFKDIVNFSDKANRIISFEDLPNLFIHNDYDSRVFDKLNKNVYLFNDGKTKVIAEDKIELRFNLKAKGNYSIRPNFVEFYESSFSIPHLYLFNLKIESAQFGKIYANLLYFSFENINLFEFFVANSIKIDFMVKVREGYSLGGNRMSVTQVYFLLSRINLKYLINDTEIHWDWEVINQLIKMRSKLPKSYKLNQIQAFENWDDYFKVFVNKLNYHQTDSLNLLIEEIRSNFDPKFDLK